MEPQLTPVKPLRCGSYRPGHDTHWIPVLRVYTRAERHPVTLEGISDDGWMIFKQGDATERRWHHDAPWVRSLVGSWRRVGESEFFEVGGTWVCTGAEATACPSGGTAPSNLTSEDLIGMIEDRGGFTVRLTGG